jgi:hypothetical protein
MAKQPTVEEMQATILAQQEKLSAILIRMNEPPAPAQNAFEAAREAMSLDGVIERQQRDGVTDAGPIKRNIKVPCYHSNGARFTAIVELPSRAFPQGRIVNVEDLDFSGCFVPEFERGSNSQARPLSEDPAAAKSFKQQRFIHETYRHPLFLELNVGKAPLHWSVRLDCKPQVDAIKAKMEAEMAALNAQMTAAQESAAAPAP